MKTFIVKTCLEGSPIEIQADSFEQVSREHPIVVKFLKDRETVALITGVTMITEKETK